MEIQAMRDIDPDGEENQRQTLQNEREVFALKMMEWQCTFCWGSGDDPDWVGSLDTHICPACHGTGKRTP